MEKPMLDPKSIAKKHILLAIATILGGIIISFILAFPAKWLWNWLVPTLFAGPEVSAVQAWGLIFLARMILPLGSTNVTGQNKNNPK